MDQNQKLRTALVIIFSLRIRHFNLEPRISQKMMSYKQMSMFRCLRFLFKKINIEVEASWRGFLEVPRLLD